MQDSHTCIQVCLKCAGCPWVIGSVARGMLTPGEWWGQESVEQGVSATAQEAE